MENIATVLLLIYSVFYIGVFITSFFNKHKYIKSTLKYSTILLIILITFLGISLWIDGTLFKNININTYF